MKRYLIVGDITHPGRIEVEADSLDAAFTKAEKGDFVIYDEGATDMAFTWNGDQETIEVDEIIKLGGGDASEG